MRQTLILMTGSGYRFQGELCINQPSEILTLYNFHHLIPLYPSILFESTIRYLVLHILPSFLVPELATILSLSNLV